MSVYFISEGEYIKIGFSDNPMGRLSKLQSGHPRRLVMIGYFRGAPMQLEWQLHARFASLRALGEWFQAAPELLQYIEAERLRGALTVPPTKKPTRRDPTKKGGRFRSYAVVASEVIAGCPIPDLPITQSWVLGNWSGGPGRQTLARCIGWLRDDVGIYEFRHRKVSSLLTPDMVKMIARTWELSKAGVSKDDMKQHILKEFVG